MKILRLTLILLIMYAVFLITIVPVLVVVTLSTLNRRIFVIESAISNLMFFIASLINPLLTLSLKEDFRICFSAGAKGLTQNTINLK